MRAGTMGDIWRILVIAVDRNPCWAAFMQRRKDIDTYITNLKSSSTSLFRHRYHA